MPVIQSGGTLADLEAGRLVPADLPSHVELSEERTSAYTELYRSQPNLRTVIDFLGRSIGQLGLHTFRRLSDNNRERVHDVDVARLLARPNGWTTPYRLKNTLVQDLAIFARAYWWKLGDELIPLPPLAVTPLGSWLSPERFQIAAPGGRVIEVPEAEIIWFRGYAPEHGLSVAPPIESLRQILAEEYHAGNHRKNMWKNSARVESVVTRPNDAPTWSDEARKRFREEFERLYSGERNSGRTAILEEGMDLKEIAWSAKDAEYVASRKLTREEVAAAFHVPLPMVGILDNATYSNIREQHKQLYMDSLGPWLTEIEDEIRLQMVTDPDIYVEFNLKEKLRGDFEQQVQAYQAAVGAPHMTVNEARAQQNLPPVEGADELVVPMNVTLGGQASPQDVTPGRLSAAPQAKGMGQTPSAQDTVEDQHRRVFARHFRRQQSAVSDNIKRRDGQTKDRADEAEELLGDLDRWDRELSDDLMGVALLGAQMFGRELYPDYDPRVHGLEWLQARSRRSSEAINRTTLNQIEKALEDAVEDALDEALETDPEITVEELESRFGTVLSGAIGASISHMFAVALDARAEQMATTASTELAGFGRNEAALESGRSMKRWRVTSANPRDSHAEVNGETVPLRELFSNGMKWPGDSQRGEVGDKAGCTCVLEYL